MPDGKRRVECQGLAIFRFGIILSALEQDIAEIGVSAGELRVKFEGPANLTQGSIIVTQFVQNVAQSGVRICTLRIEHRGLSVFGGRRCELMLLFEHETKVQMAVRSFRFEFDRCTILLGGIFQLRSEVMTLPR